MSLQCRPGLIEVVCGGAETGTEDMAKTEAEAEVAMR